MEINCIIRKAEHADIPSLIALLKVLFSMEKDFQPEESKQQKGLEMMLESPATRCVLVAEINKQVAGMVTAQLLVSTAEGGPVALIEDVIVDEEYRKNGIGRQLLLSMESWAKEKGASRLQLLADRNNTPALGFYNSLNWKATNLICLHRKQAN